ncbi:alpha-tocopherol transfer protein-like [Coccinella septempunctata]|uniref:alpha-tocopherol transfer protein-like n=1 Tax=Coccinella septempunctata TaxID=41139 RepID=UPI001D0848A5|nr:alpha-tocopherol transfer protein-like [Coccinella septempunctata]
MMELAKKFSENRNEVLSAYELTEEDVNRCISDLRIWLEGQKHLQTHLLGDDLLERFLLKNKFSIEKTKIKMENYCTLRKKYRKFYENYEEIVPSKESSFIIPMFKLNDDLNRIIICRIFDEKKFDFLRSARGIMLMLEMESRMDYSCGDEFIVDLAGTGALFLTKINFLLLKDALTLAIKAYSARVRAVHIVNAPRIINVLMTLLKTIVPTKIFNRIRVHRSLDTVYEYFPKRLLPLEYGGELGSLNTILADYDLIFKECQDTFSTALQIATDETKKTTKRTPDDESFRKLQID